MAREHPTFGWIYFSADERNEIGIIRELMKDRYAIDELGIGRMRDRISDTLFPGSSTLHTHARYLFFVPYLFKYLETHDAGNPISQIQEDLRSGEKRIMKGILSWRDSLPASRSSSDIRNITGSTFANRDGWVQQTVTSTYWNALKTYGIRVDTTGHSLRINSLISQISRSSRNRQEKGAKEDDPVAPYKTATAVRWHVPLEDYRQWHDAYENHLSMPLDLTPAESDQLLGTIRDGRYSDSLYGHFLRSEELVNQLRSSNQSDSGDSTGRNFVRFANSKRGDVEALTGFQNWPLIDMAADFSSLVAILHVRFNWIIWRKAAECEPEEFKEIPEKYNYLNPDYDLYLERARNCDLDALFSSKTLREPEKENIHFRTMKDFLVKAQKALVEKDTSTLDETIRGREEEVKTQSRSKIRNALQNAREARDSGHALYGGLELDYRLPIAINMAHEILHPHCESKGTARA